MSKKAAREFLFELACAKPNLSADTLNNLSADTLNNLSADTLNNLSAYTLNNLSAYTLNKLKEYQELVDAIPVLSKPYTQLLNDIKENKRTFKQSVWGNIETWEQACDAKNNICNTPMCQAGALIHMAGKAGYELKQYLNSWERAATIIFKKANPDLREPNFLNTSQESALVFIEETAKLEK